MRPQTQTIFKINYSKTLQNIKASIDQLPAQVINGKTRRAIKGNVNATAFHIYRLFMGTQKKKTRVSTGFRTTNPSLAKVSNNCTRTIQRHIQKLIDLKIILGKARLGHGIQLILNQELLAFDTQEVPVKPKPSSEAATGQETGQNPEEMIKKLFAKFPSVRRSAGFSTVNGQKV